MSSDSNGRKRRARSLTEVAIALLSATNERAKSDASAPGSGQAETQAPGGMLGADAEPGAPTRSAGGGPDPERAGTS